MPQWRRQEDRYVFILLRSRHPSSARQITRWHSHSDNFSGDVRIVEFWASTENSRNCTKVSVRLDYLHTYLLTYSMEQNPSWEANWFSASQEIPRILWNPKFHYRIQKCPPTVPILIQLDPVHTPTSHFLKIHLNIPRTKSHIPFSLLRLHQSISPGPRLTLWSFRNMVRFYSEELLAFRPNPSYRTTPCRLSATAYSI